MPSDSCDQNMVEFNALEHFQNLAEGKKFRLSDYIDVSYVESWKGIIETLTDELKCYSIEITRVEDTYGQLEISFNPLAKSHEVSVWRLLHDAKNLSRSLCVVCGSSISHIRPRLGIKNKCRICENAGKGGTGTWLDKY